MLGSERFHARAQHAHEVAVVVIGVISSCREQRDTDADGGALGQSDADYRPPTNTDRDLVRVSPYPGRADVSCSR